MTLDLNSTEVAGLIMVALIVGLGAGATIAEQQTIFEAPVLETNGDGTISSAETKLVAVDREGNGLVTDLQVRTVPGDGSILVNIDSLLFFLDTQHSIQSAKEAAETHLNLTVSERDIVYDIEIDNSSAVGGESAGGALTIATIAALQGKELRNDTVMTGTINPDGTIGMVGGVAAKSRAASEAGYSTFLVPAGQGTYSDVVKERSCREDGGMTVCTTDFARKTINVGEDMGINVVEVANVQEAADLLIAS